jgi:hypothetical protein
MSIVEYLYNLNQVQELCNLSLDEFYKAMLASTTGVPYTYLMGAINPLTSEPKVCSRGLKFFV